MSGFWSEMKRRNVYRVTVAYSLVAWLLVQVAATLFPAFGVPESLFRGLVILLILGCPVVIALAWAFELTPDGIQLEQPIDAGNSGNRSTGRKLDFVIIGLLTVAVFYLALQTFVLQPGSRIPIVAPFTRYQSSVAALPFMNNGTDADSRVFAAGIYDDLLTQLMKIPNMRVISRTSISEYAATTKNMHQIGDELSVKHVLEGAVQKAGNRVRINVKLINAETESNVWAETYDRELTTSNIFAMQSEIARKISNALEITLSPETVKDLSDIPTENIDAYGYYVAALDIINDSNKQLVIQESQHAIELLQSAVAADPNFALAWIRLAGELEWTNGEHFEPALEAQFQAALARANAINPDLPELHLVRAKYFSDRQRFNDALVELELAARGMPGNADVYRRRYWALKGLGRGEEARADLEQAMELDPRNVGVLMNYGWELRQLRRYAEARKHFARAIAAFPTVWLLRMHNAELEMVQYGDYDPLKRTWLRLDAPRDAPSYAPTVSMFAWISGDTQTALDYARRPTPSTADLENALTAAETRAWVYRAAGLDADGKASAGEALRLMRQALQERPDDPNILLASARLSVFFGDDSNAIKVANEGFEASQSEAGQRFIGAYYPDRFRMDYGRVLCSAGDLSAAENEFRRMLSKENGSTLPYLINDWPPCKERMLGTEAYLRLQKEFGHLSEGVAAPTT